MASLDSHRDRGAPVPPPGTRAAPEACRWADLRNRTFLGDAFSSAGTCEQARDRRARGSLPCARASRGRGGRTLQSVHPVLRAWGTAGLSSLTPLARECAQLLPAGCAEGLGVPGSLRTPTGFGGAAQGAALKLSGPVQVAGEPAGAWCGSPQAPAAPLSSPRVPPGVLRAALRARGTGTATLPATGGSVHFCLSPSLIF